MTDNQKRLVELLKEMFQFEQADLDFGIYRVMNLKRKEISKYLNETLLKQISDGINVLCNAENESKINELKGQIESTKSSSLPQEIKEQAINALQNQINDLSKTDISDIEGDVYNHLINFFSRYYDEGDFISQRRYKDGVYAIPYEGEEVKLYWANADQYYVKTAEYFTDYTFKTSYGKTVIFKVLDAETERDNNRANEKKFFVLHDEKLFSIEDGILTIYFEYKNADYKKQEDANKKTFELLKQNIQDAEWTSIFVAPNSREKSEFERQLFRYTAKNTYDYFIHKDLGKFLKRELDFYIKNEVIYLDDIQTNDMNKTKEYLVKAQVIREVASRIIEFLAQIENFQKKMYLKKKFVVDTQYCITLDRIPEEMYPEIAANDRQREEWVKLFAIDEIESTQDNILEEGKVGYSVPITIDFLKQNPYLVLDTQFFCDSFKEKLIESIDNFDNNFNGLLINSDNYQALRLLNNRYSFQIDAVYIDPPYNTNASEIVYKNGYKHSSWNTMIEERITEEQKLIKNSSFTTVTIDYEELFDLGKILDSKFGSDNRVGIVTIFINPKGRQHERFFASSTEYMLVYAKNTAYGNFNLTTIDSVKTDDFIFSDEKGKYRLDKFERVRTSTLRINKPQGFYGVYVSPDLKTLSIEEHDGWECVYPTVDNIDYTWKKIKEKFYEYNDDNLLVALKEDDGKIHIYNKYYEQQVFHNIWANKKYYSEFNGTNLLKDILGDNIFSYPKSIYAVEDVLKIMLPKEGIVLDYFAGSGTTGHAAINLNREGGDRKYILCEMGDYFNTVTRPRIEKVIYSKEYDEGKPVDRNGISQIVKYIRLESYEDSLNNIKFDERMEFLPDNMRDEYVLKYMLESDAHDSMFNVKALEHPFNYAMSITRKQEAKWTNVDVVETFNYLIGLVVENNYAKCSFDANFVETEYGALKAELTTGNKYIFKMVKGHLLNGERVLVIWRNMTDDIIKDNAALDALLVLKSISTTNDSFNKIYVNCDNNLPNPNGNKVFLIEEEMQKRMFEE